MPEKETAAPSGPRPPVSGPGGSGALRDHNSDIFFAAVETTRMPMIVTDPNQPDNPIVFANQAFLAMTGYESGEIVGSNCRFLQCPETDPETLADVRRAIAERREIAVEVLNRRKNGSTFWNALFVSPIYNREGELVYFFGSQLDVSRRRDAEESLRQSQKMEAIGQLTGGIAHDFNNLLQVIIGYVDTVRYRIERSGDARALRGMDNIADAAQRAATLTQQLLAFARKQRLEGRTVSLNTLVENMGKLARRTLGETIEIRVSPAPDLWNCRLDPVQAELALLNILINARDAMPDGGTVTITTENREVDEADAAFGPLQPGRYAAISITDTGVGMAPDVLERVLEPFFTTKEEGKGTGLGLSMVYGFVKQSGGVVRLYSEPGYGTTVRLYFPAAGDAERPRPGAASIRAIDRPGAGESVLVVEDRADVADLARAILEDFGYAVSTAGDAKQALELLDNGARVDLLFSDLIMPGGMNGVTLAREARKRQPKIKVLLTTGYAEASIDRTDLDGTGFELIGKPYRRTELARRVRMVLDGPTGVG